MNKGEIRVPVEPEIIFETKKAPSEQEQEYRKKYVMCPTVGCTEKLIGSWKDYVVPDEKRHGLTVYQCPGCGARFTVNDFKVNAVAVPNYDGTAVLYNKNTQTIVAKIPGNTRFIDVNDDAYMNIPLMLLSDPGTVMMYLTDINADDFTDKEIIEVIRKQLGEIK